MGEAAGDRETQLAPVSRRAFLGGGVGVVALAATGCIASLAAADGTLRVARSESFDGWVPDKAATYATYQTLTAVLEPLLRVAPDGSRVVPGIAESWRYDADTTSWIFTLRDDVRFSDGSPLTAPDVVFSAGVWKAGPNFGSNYAFDRARSRGPRTVVFEMAHDDASFPSRLASQPSAVFPKDYAGRSERDYFVQPIGAGAFLVDEWSPTGRITLLRNPRYYRGPRPHIDRLQLEVADESTAAAQFLSGQVHLCEFVGVQGAPQYGDDLTESPPSQVNHLSLNTTRAPLGDARLRQAIAHAIDYEGIIEGAFLGYASRAGGILPPNVPNYAPPSVASFEQNVSAARRLMQAVPKPAGPLELTYDADVAADDLIAQIIASNLADIGIDVELAGMETGAFLDRAYGLDADMTVWSYGAITPDISDPLGWILGTSYLFTGADAGTLRRRYNAYLAAPSAAARSKIVTEIQDEALRNAAAIPLSNAPVLTGVSQRLRGFGAAPWGLYYWDSIDVAG